MAETKIEALNPDYADRNVAAEAADPNSLWSLYRSLIQLRNQHAALRVGDFHAVTSTSSTVFSILRISQSEAVLVLINLDKNAVGDTKLFLASSALSAGTYHAVPMLGTGPVADLTVNAQGDFAGYLPLPTLPPYSSLILQLQK
jgi:glycosidase